MLYLDKQVRANALCTSQTRKIELTEQTMVGVLSNEGINARKKEGNPLYSFDRGRQYDLQYRIS